MKKNVSTYFLITLFLLAFVGCGQSPEEAFKSATEKFKTDYKAAAKEGVSESPEQTECVTVYEKKVDEIISNLSDTEKAKYKEIMSNTLFLQGSKKYRHIKSNNDLSFGHYSDAKSK